ncbi:MAG: metallopeptidase TldD-related protein, partial [Acidimicrobiales bacterium]
SESPESLAISPGSLPSDGVLDALGTGIYLGNLWYANYSDRSACRTTGLTRFASFWVEGGEIVAPINVMRFDDTIYNLLGDELVGLTNETEMMLDPSSYGERSTTSINVPGALVAEMKFTL